MAGINLLLTALQGWINPIGLEFNLACPFRTEYILVGAFGALCDLCFSSGGEKNITKILLNNF